MTCIYVTSIAPGDGKTAVSAGLAAVAASRGTKAAYFKPVTLAAGENGAPDADFAFCNGALGPMGVTASPAPVAASTDALTSGLGGTAQQVRSGWAGASRQEMTVVDGLPTGLTARASAELADLLDASVVAVIRYRRGQDLEDVVALRETFGERLRGVLLNAVPSVSLREAGEVTAPALEEQGLRCLGILPEERALMGFTVAEYGALLGGRIINNEERADELVESLLIGAMALDPGELYYERTDNKALITRGDRPDLQWSALDSSTRCLILTQDTEPIPYVLNKAQEVEVPVVVVPKGTLETVGEIEGFITQSTFHHPLKLARFAEMLELHVDLAALGL